MTHSLPVRQWGGKDLGLDPIAHRGCQYLTAQLGAPAFTWGALVIHTHLQGQMRVRGDLIEIGTA